MLEAAIQAGRAAFAGPRWEVAVAWRCLGARRGFYRLRISAGQAALGRVRIEVDPRLDDTRAHVAVMVALAQLQMAELYGQCCDVLAAGTSPAMAAPGAEGSDLIEPDLRPLARRPPTSRRP